MINQSQLEGLTNPPKPEHESAKSDEGDIVRPKVDELAL